MGQKTSHDYEEFDPDPKDQKKPEPNLPNPAPISGQPMNPFQNPYGYRENPAIYFNKNPSNEKNRIFIARSCFGGYITSQYSPGLSFNRIEQKEFDNEIEKINDVVSSFKFVKCLYILMTIMILISLVILFVGISLNPDFSISTSSNFQDQNIAYNVVTGFGFVLILINVIVFTMAVICTLKKYEFMLAKHFNQINKDSYLTRNVYWRIGGFCRFIELNILPLQPEFFWFLQTNEGKEVEFNNIKGILNV